MKISIIGSNGMLSRALTKYFFSNGDTIVDVYGLDAPDNYKCSHYYPTNLLRDTLDYEFLASYDVIIYASGAGVQAALKTDSSLMYALNVNVPIEMTLQLKKHNYKGTFISFGSYMEIGLNNDENKVFDEEGVTCSSLPVSNDYALSKRLFGRYMKDFMAEYTHLHFILPNMFSEDDLKPGTRLVPYILKYLQDFKAGKKPESPRFSSGTQTRQFITMEEVMIVLSKALEKNISSGIYCVGGGEFLSIRSLIERLFKLYGVPCNEDYFGKEVRRDGDIKSLHVDGTKLFNAIGYLPKNTIEIIFNPRLIEK